MNGMWAWVHQVWQTLHEGQVPQLGVWSYVLVGVLVATEGPLTTLVAAAAAAAGLMDVRLVFLVTMVGNIVGDTLWYGMGHAGKAGLVERAPKWMGVTADRVERLEHEMRNHALKLIVVAKIAYGLMVPTLLAAGIARVPWRRWFPVVFVVETLWSALLVWAGYHAAGLLGEFERGLRIAGLVGLLVAVAAVVWFMLRRKWAKPKSPAGDISMAKETKPDSSTWLKSVEWNGAHAAPTLVALEAAVREDAAPESRRRS